LKTEIQDKKNGYKWLRSS